MSLWTYSSWTSRRIRTSSVQSMARGSFAALRTWSRSLSEAPSLVLGLGDCKAHRWGIGFIILCYRAQLRSLGCRSLRVSPAGSKCHHCDCWNPAQGFEGFLAPGMSLSWRRMKSRTDHSLVPEHNRADRWTVCTLCARSHVLLPFMIRACQPLEPQIQELLPYRRSHKLWGPQGIYIEAKSSTRQCRDKASSLSFRGAQHGGMRSLECSWFRLWGQNLTMVWCEFWFFYCKLTVEEGMWCK